MTFEEYRKADALNCSKLKSLMNNPHEYFLPHIDKACFQFGHLFHTMVLEPELLNHEYAVLEKCDGRTKEGKAKMAALLLRSAGKTIIREDDWLKSAAMTKNISNCAPEYFEEGVAERSFFSEMWGYKVKGRIDYYQEIYGRIIDLKQCADSSPDKFFYAAKDYGYFAQAYFYTKLMRSLKKPADEFFFICVQNTYPFMVAIYKVNDAGFEYGKMQIEEALRIYNDPARLKLYELPLYRDKEMGKVLKLGVTDFHLQNQESESGVVKHQLSPQIEAVLKAMRKAS